MEQNEMPREFPPQHQDRMPGLEKDMQPRPVYDSGEPGSNKLKDMVAIITGGDSGIGRAVAVSFAREGCDVVISYLDEHDDAEETAEAVRRYGRQALLIPGDITSDDHCRHIVTRTLETFGKIDILVNNAAVQYKKDAVEEISAEQLDYTFRVNIYAQFYLCKHALPHMKPGSSIINTASVNAYRGNQMLMDYSATKGAIVAFTRSLAQAVVQKGIRVNGVAPGPVWTPLIPASFEGENVAKLGQDTPMGRSAQPFEIAPCYVFLASKDAAFLTGQFLHPNGGTVINT